MKILIHLIFTLNFCFYCIGQNNSFNKEFFQTIDTIKNHSNAINQLNIKFYNSRLINSRDTLDFTKRLAHRYIYLQKYDKALININKSILITKEYSLDSVQSYMLGLKGKTYYYLGKKIEAIKFFEDAIKLAKEHNYYHHLANIYSNIGAIKLEQNQKDVAIDYLKKSIKIYDSLKLNETSNYFLSNRLLGNYYYDNKEFNKALNIYSHITKKAKELYLSDIQSSSQTFKALTLAQLGFFKEAEVEFNEVINLQAKVNNKDTEIAVLSHYVKYLESRKKYKEAFLINNKVYSLKSEIFDEKLITSVAETESKFKTDIALREKKNAELNLQKKNIEIENIKEARNKQSLIILLLIISLCFIILFFLIINKYRKLKTSQFLERERLKLILLGEEKVRVEIAKELHDGIVQELYSIKNEMNIKNEKNNKVEVKVINKIDEIAQEIRDLSYKMMPISLKEFGLEKAIESLLERTLLINKIKYEYNYVGLENRISDIIELNIYRIMQELVNNVIKHSNANFVDVYIILTKTNISLTFKDNGKGIESQDFSKSIGLNSINSRIELLNGRIEVDADLKNGTAFYFNIPLSKV